MNKNVTNIIQIVVGLLLIGLIMIQSKGGGLGSTFGGFAGVYRSKRGVEKALYILTIGISFTFFLVTVVSFIFF